MFLKKLLLALLPILFLVLLSTSPHPSVADERMQTITTGDVPIPMSVVWTIYSNTDPGTNLSEFRCDNPDLAHLELEDEVPPFTQFNAPVGNRVNNSCIDKENVSNIVPKLNDVEWISLDGWHFIAGGGCDDPSSGTTCQFIPEGAEFTDERLIHETRESVLAKNPGVEQFIVNGFFISNVAVIILN
jgi:hypothetical protein